MNPLHKIDKSWNEVISLLHLDTKLQDLNTKILPSIRYYPNKENIFNVFQMPINDIRVVILGQDPYPKEGQAIGYAFAVNEGINKPASLRIIEKEIGHNIDRTLKDWREQGVFLLNTALTVEQNKAGSHLKYWDNFIANVISYISSKNPCIWVLWGKYAQQYKYLIQGNGEGNVILTAPHPAAEAYKANAGFIGCNHFNMINDILSKQGKQTINW